MADGRRWSEWERQAHLTYRLYCLWGKNMENRTPADFLPEDLRTELQ